MSSILSHKMGIREWAPFHKRFEHKPSDGESACFGLSCFVFPLSFSLSYYLRLVEFLLLESRRGVRKVRAPIIAFHQPTSSARSVPKVAMDEGVQSLAILWSASASEPIR